MGQSAATLAQPLTEQPGSLVNLASLGVTKDSETALAGSGRAISLLNDVLKRNSGIVTVRLFLRSAHWVRAEAYDSMRYQRLQHSDEQRDARSSGTHDLIRCRLICR